MIVLDLDVLAAFRPRALELAERVKTGDLVAAFDAELLLGEIDRATAAAVAFVNNLEHTPQEKRDAGQAADGLLYVIFFVSGSSELQAALDDAREPADD